MLAALVLSIAVSVGPAFAQSAVALNNEGIKALNDKDFATAINRFKDSLAVDPNYALARKNLGIAYNNYGIALKDEPLKALRNFHRALYYNETDPKILQCIVAIITKLGRDPKNYYDRVGLGDQAAKANDFIGAVVEYKAALLIKADPETENKLKDAELRADEETKSGQAAAAQRVKSSSENQADCVKKLDTYASVVKELIVAHWKYPKGITVVTDVQVNFMTHGDGKFTDITIRKSSGNKMVDDSAVQAVTTVSGMMPRPACLPSSKDYPLSFQLTINVHTKKTDKMSF